MEGKQAEASNLWEQVESLRKQGEDDLRMKDEEMAVVMEKNGKLHEQLQQMKTSTDCKTNYLETKLTTSENLVAEFQSMLLQKNKELEEMARILDSRQCAPTPKPRTRFGSKHKAAQPQRLPPTVSEACDKDCPSTTPTESSNEISRDAQYPSLENDRKLKLHCTLKASLPQFGMTRGSATSDQNFAYFTQLGSRAVHRYSLSGDTWSLLPQCPYRNCGLAIVDGALVALGGRKACSDYSNKLLTLRMTHWFEELPPMTVARDSPSLVVVEHGSGTNILVAGGSVSDSRWTASVEILNGRTKRWCSLVDLPKPLAFPSAALRQTTTSGTLLLSVVDAYRECYACSLYLSNESVMASGWSSLPKLPASGSTATVLRGELVVVGGLKSSSSSVSCIHQLIDNQWVQLGTVSTGTECLIASTHCDQLVIVGGDGGCDNVCVCSV
ncbi:hypothetical protein GBAR_LOCUS7129 [Geodia barretti]|uniref:Uncharacterized protein n=2 Tax=Geodia barretti TaxID=519541 RepID=A0AA35RHU6_GEOBA|nr:hypothetical protein GBAR_LOCUS7129 [Geodia barretti]